MAGGKGAGVGVGQTTSGQWRPTVRYLLVIVAVELVIYGAMRYYTRHGG